VRSLVIGANMVREMRDAVRCHFDDDDVERPEADPLHLVRDEVIAA